MTALRSTAAPHGPSLAQAVARAGRLLRSRRGLIALGAAALGLGAALNWSWLVAAGIAPVLLSLLPCAAMCALGLCMNRILGNREENAGIDPSANAADPRAQVSPGATSCCATPATDRSPADTMRV